METLQTKRTADCNEADYCHASIVATDCYFGKLPQKVCEAELQSRSCQTPKTI